MRGVREPPAPAARVPAVHRGSDAFVVSHEFGFRGLGQVGSGYRVGVDGDGEPGAGRGLAAGDGPAGQDAARRAGVGAPGGVR